MTFKQFYLICLLGVTLFGGIYLCLLWIENHKRSKQNNFIKEINQGLLFIILAFFSWSVVALYKFFDVKDFTLSYIINDRILSSLNNLFFFSSLAFFPLKKEFLLTKYFRKKEQWIINVFIFFAFIIAFFTITDKVSDDIGVVSKWIIIALDSIVSISSIVAIGYVLYYSFKEILSNTRILNYIKIIFILFASTQILLPLSKLIPEYLSVFYPFFLAFFVVFLSMFIFLIAIYYTLIAQSFSNNSFNNNGIVDNDFKLNEIIEVKKISLGYNKESKEFYLNLNFNTKEGKSMEDIISSSKLLQPYLYWLLFSKAKLNDSLISHQDIAIAKFRMVEYWNKESNFKLNQDVLFYNESGNFEYRVDKDAISIKDMDFFKSKMPFKEIIRKHYICFISPDILKSKQLFNKKNAEKYIEDNFNTFFDSL